MALPNITASGNIVADPELRYTNGGKAVASFRIACNSKRKDQQGNWVDGDTTFLSVSVWEGLAENVASQLTKGQRVNVSGRLTQREYEKDGQKRTVYEVRTDDVSVPISRFSDDNSRFSDGSSQQQPASNAGFGGGFGNSDAAPF